MIFAGLIAKIGGSLIFGRAKAIAGSIPWQLWAAIGVLALVGVGGCVHGQKVRAFGKAQYQAGEAHERETMQKKLDRAHQEALDWKAKAEAKAAAISQDIRGKHEATLRSNSTLADDLRLHGSGAARCGQGDHSVIPARTGGHEQTAGNADAAGHGLPAEDRAAVPWGWLIGRAEQCDANLSESMSWRQWYQRQVAASAAP